MPDLMIRRRPYAVLPALGVLFGVVTAHAGPLDGEQCAALSAKITALDQAGVKGVLEKGPAAAKATLTKDQREQIRTYLDALGTLRFRCPSEAPFVVLKQEPPEDPAEAGATTAPIEANAPGITLPPGVAAAVVAPIAPKKPPVPKQPKAAAASATKAVDPATTAKPKAQPSPPAAKAANPAPQPTAATPAAAAKPKPKAKSDDAFKPGAPATTPAAAPAQTKAP